MKAHQKHLLPYNKKGGGKGQSYFSVLIIGLICVFGCLEGLIVILYSGGNSHQNNHPLLQNKPLDEQVQDLQNQLLKLQLEASIYVHDNKFIPFSIRDSRRLVPTQLSKDFHVFDYVDVHSPNQVNTRNAQLVQNGHFVAKAPCQRYNIKCYKQKIMQVFEHVLTTYPYGEYFFYMESDNDLCVSLSHIRDLAYREQRYFIATGIGFSGYVMSRQFVVDFLQAYNKPHSKEAQPDPIASYLLIQKKAWSATRQYLVSHTSIASLGSKSLTIDDHNNKMDKHLPKCFEPRRGKWSISSKDPRDKFGWDYFDYDACPDADIFPCQEGQLEEEGHDDVSTKGKSVGSAGGSISNYKDENGNDKQDDGDDREDDDAKYARDIQSQAQKVTSKKEKTGLTIRGAQNKMSEALPNPDELKEILNAARLQRLQQPQQKGGVRKGFGKFGGGRIFRKGGGAGLMEPNFPDLE